MFLLIIFLALIFIATNNLSPTLMENFSFGFWNMASTIGPDTNRRKFEIESSQSININQINNCNGNSDYCAVGGGGTQLGSHLRHYPHYSLTD